jgi:hypothetical protein
MSGSDDRSEEHYRERALEDFIAALEGMQAATESIANALHEILKIAERQTDEPDEPDEYDEEEEEHIDLFAGIGGIRKGFEGDKSCPERGEKRN